MKVYDRTKKVLSEALNDDFYADDNNQRHVKSDLKSITRNHISTKDTSELQRRAIEEEYEDQSIKYNKSKRIKQNYQNTQKQKSDKISKNRQNKSSKSTVKWQEQSRSASSSKSASKGSGGKGKAGYAQTAMNLEKSIRPETLKAQNWTAKKNKKRMDYIRNGPSLAAEDDAARHVGSIFTRTFNKLREIHWNLSWFVFQFNWIAGLIVLIVPIIFIGVCFIIFVIRLGINVLPSWAFTQQFQVRQLMTQYEYYWDCVNYEAEAAVENEDLIAVSVTKDSEGNWNCNTSSEEFIDWRTVLAVYYAGMWAEPSLGDSELPTVPNTGYVTEALFNEESESYFNKVFWTMNCVIPSGDQIVFECDDISELTDKEYTYIGYNICYHPTLADVEYRLGFNLVQMSLVQLYLTEQYDYYFEPLIEARHVSSSNLVAETAAAEIGQSGTKYQKWAGSYTAWCCYFVNWCLETSGNGKFIAAGGVTSSYNIWKDSSNVTLHYGPASGSKQDGSIEPQPGWLVIYEWGDGDDYRDHIGIVESYDKSASYPLTTIEGNVGSEYVRRLHRDTSKVYCYVEPNYGNAQTDFSKRYYYISVGLLDSDAEQSEIKNVAIEYLNSGEKYLQANLILNECYQALVTYGIAEWQVNDISIMHMDKRPISEIYNHYVVDGKTTHSATFSIVERFIISYDVSTMTWSNYYKMYCAYYKRHLVPS